MASSSAIVIHKERHGINQPARILVAVDCLGFGDSAAIIVANDTSRRDDDSAFGFHSVCKVAEQHLPIPFSRKVRDLPCELVGLDYDSWRYIAYESLETVWRAEDLPFQFETGHRGYLFTQRVELNEVTQLDTLRIFLSTPMHSNIEIGLWDIAFPVPSVTAAGSSFVDLMTSVGQQMKW